MNNSFLINDIQANFQTKFEGCTLEYETTSFNSGLVHCFFVNIPSEVILKVTWVEISNFIAINFQNKLDNEFERWNIYLFYRIENMVSRVLHYSIENDTFSSRKIIVNTRQSKSDIIDEHILNKDMAVGSTTAQNEGSFTPNVIIDESLKGIKSKKRLGLEIETSLEEIISKIKNSSL
jgi:hypothetical protein